MPRLRPSRHVALVALVALLVGGRSAPATAADDLSKAVAAYLREASPKKRDALWATSLRALETRPIADVERLIAEAFPGPDRRVGFQHGIQVRARGEEWTYSARISKAAAKSRALVPLVLDAGHGSLADAKEKDVEDVMENWLRTAGATDDVVYVRTRVIDRLSTDQRYDDWSKKSRPPKKENLDTIAAVLLEVVRDACLRFPIDPDRVHLVGVSQTGFWAWHLAAFAPERFASVAPMSSVTWHVSKLLPALRKLPIYVLHGTADAKCKFGPAEATVASLNALGGDVTFLVEDGGEHIARTWLRWREGWPKMATRHRGVQKEVSRVFLSAERPYVGWLSGSGLDDGGFDTSAAIGTLAGTIEGQEIRVTSEGFDSVTIHLGSMLVDLAKPVRVVVNGKKKYEGTPKPSARDALDTASERGDPAAAWAVRIRVPAR